MARSFIDPSLVALATEPAAPPWNWNPGATFVEAFNESQRTRMMQEKMAMEQELNRILLPAKAAEAEFNLKKFTLDAQLLEKMHKAKSASLDAAYRGITSAIGGGGSGGSSSGSSSGGSGAGTQPSKGFQSQFGFGSKFSNPPQAAPISKPSWRVVTPAQPQPGP